MALRVRRGKWHYRFEINGHEWTGSTGLVASERNRKPAERIELEAKQAIEQGRSHILNVQAVPFTEAADKFLSWCESAHRNKPNTWRRVKTSFASLVVYFGRKPVNAVTQGDVADYAAWRANEHHVKDVTIRHDLHSLSKFFKYALKHNWCRDNPVATEDIPSDEGAVRMHVFTDREEKTYLSAAERHPKLRDLATLMLYQGCRPEELLAVKLPDVDLERRYLHIDGGKTRNARRDVRIRPECLPTMPGWSVRRRGDTSFAANAIH